MESKGVSATPTGLPMNGAGQAVSAVPVGIPDAGHLFAPRWLPNGATWEPEPGKCRAACSESSGNSTHFWQCTRNIKVEREVSHLGRVVTVGYCGMHDPVKVEERKRARDAQWRAKIDGDARQRANAMQLRALKDAALEAIRKIAAGHNDPRALAMEVLAQGGEARQGGDSLSGSVHEHPVAEGHAP